MDDISDIIQMISTRGNVVDVKRWEVSMLKEQGWKIIRNPKQRYYPEYDYDLNPKLDLTENIAENIDEGDLLEGEFI